MVDMFLIKFDPDGNEKFKYRLGNFEGFTYDINSPVTPAPLPEEDSSDNVLVKIEGNSSILKLRWKIHNTDTNREILVPVATKTMPENILFFKNQFRPVSIEDSYSLLIDFPLTPITWFGTIANIHMNTTKGEPVTLNASTSFLEGTIIALYDIDVPSQPTNFSITSTVAGEIDVAWTTPFDEGSSAITGYRIQYALLGDNFTNQDVGVVTNDTISGLVSSQIYIVRVAAISNNGTGRFTITKEILVT